MKYLILFIGIILFIVGFIQTTRYVLNYDALTQYGKGYVWGSAILMLIGIIIIFIGKKIDRKNTST
jgi:hypothetical protein